MSKAESVFPVEYHEFNKHRATNENRMFPVRKRLIPLLMILLVIVVAVIIYVYRDGIAALGNLGYLGVFLISLVSCATVVLPMPGMLLIFALGSVFNPFIVGLVAALGGTLGETSGYILGLNGRSLIPDNKIFINTERWMRKWGVMTIFVFSLIPPLSFDIVGITAGGLRFPVWKFLVAGIFGKIVLYTGMAFLGAWGWESVLRYIGL